MSLPERTRRPDRFLKNLFASRSRSASRSKHDADTTSTATTVASTAASRAHETAISASQQISIYDSALEQLSDDDRAFFTDHYGLDECLANAKTLGKMRYGERLTWKFRGKEHSCQGAADSIIATINKFKSAGDGAVSLVPQAAIPWAVFKALLMLAVSNKEQRDFLIQGIERAVHTNYRLLVYEQELDEGLSSGNMRDTLVKLNIKILEFLAIAMRTIGHNRAVALIHPLWNLPRIEAFDKECSELLVLLAQDAASCGRAVHFQQHQQVMHKLDGVIDHLDMQLLAGAVAEGATHMSKEQMEASKCLPKTRTDLLALIETWTGNDTNIFWLCGQAGTGKSTISRTVAAEVVASGYAAASFFFKKTEAKRSHAGLLFATIVQQLVEQVPPMRSAISQALRTPALLTDRSLSEQWQKLIEGPLASLDLKVFLIIDALDECTLNDVKGVLMVLFKAQVSLKIFLTSRPDVEIVKWFQQDRHESFHLEEIEPDISRHDIKLFIDHELRDHASPDDIERLAAITTPLFIAASILCRFILAFDPDRTVQNVLQGQRWTGNMAQFYSSILQQILERLEDRATEYVQRFHATVAPLVVLSDPLAIEDLAELLGATKAAVEATLTPLVSVLGLKGRIRPLHLTFYESAPLFKAPFAVDLDAAHDLLHRGCLRVLGAGLKQDLLGLHHPGTRREDVQVSLPPVLSYACEYWRRHMRSYDRLEWFLSTHLLQWLEAMSWLNKLPSALDDLVVLSQLVTDDPLLTLVQDSRKFLQKNMYIIDEAPLQLYLSTLAFAPEWSLIRHCFGSIVDSNPYFKRLPPGPLAWDDVHWSKTLVPDAFCLDADRARLAVIARKRGLYLILVDTGVVVLHHKAVDIPSNAVSHMTFSRHDEVSIVMSIPGGSQLTTWDLLTGHVSSREFQGIAVIAVSDNLAYMTTIDKDPTLWPRLLDTRTTQSRTLRGDRSNFGKDEVYAATNTRHTALCHSQRYAYLFDNDSTTCIWRLEKEVDWIGGSIHLSASSVLVVLDMLGQIYTLQVTETAGNLDHIQLQRLDRHCLVVSEQSRPTLDVQHIDSALHVSWLTSRALVVLAIDSQESDVYEFDHRFQNPYVVLLVDRGRLLHYDGYTITYHDDRNVEATNDTGAGPLATAVDAGIDTRKLLPLERPNDLERFYSSAGYLILVTSDQVQVYKDDLQLVVSLPCGESYHTTEISPDGEYLLHVRGANDDWTIDIVPLRSGTSQGQRRRDTRRPYPLQWSPNSRYISWHAGEDLVWLDVQLGAITTMKEVCERVISLNFMKDSRAILVCDKPHDRDSSTLADRRYQIFDVEGSLLARIDASDVSSLVKPTADSQANAALAIMQSMLRGSQGTDIDLSIDLKLEASMYGSLDWIVYDSESFFWIPPSQIDVQAYPGEFIACTPTTVVVKSRSEWQALGLYLMKPGFEQRLIADCEARNKNVAYRRKA